MRRSLDRATKRHRGRSRGLWIGVWVGVVAVVAGQLLWSLGSARSQPLDEQERLGERLYVASCATCHGADAAGTADGPPLRGVGSASVDFMLRTGRMPLGAPNQQPVRQEPRFSPAEQQAVVAYLARVAPGGPGIPEVDPDRGDLRTGFALYSGICSSCHGAGATGDSIGGGRIAPSLYEAAPTEIAEAVRVGPGLMPPFGEETLDSLELDSITRYLLWLRSSGDPGGLGLGRIGPVAEGFVAILVGLGLSLLFIYLIGTKA